MQKIIARISHSHAVGWSAYYIHTLLCVISAILSHSYNNINIWEYILLSFFSIYISSKSTKRQQCTGLYGEGVFNGRSSFVFFCTLFYFCFPFLCCIFFPLGIFGCCFFFFTFTDAYLISRDYSRYTDIHKQIQNNTGKHTRVCMQCKQWKEHKHKRKKKRIAQNGEQI